MKLILLIAILLILSIANGALIQRKKQISRTLTPETLALEIEFYGSCTDFHDRVYRTAWLSNRQKCLPIQVNVTENPDFDDLNAHWFCTNTNAGRSVVHLVEVFTTDETQQIPDFVFSFVPSTPFRVLTAKTSFARRPNCWVTNDYCNTSNAVINNCKHNDVVLREDERRENGENRHGDEHREHGDEHREEHEHRFVVTNDRIYITSNQNISSECKTSETECCPYITPSIFGGICDHEAPSDLLKFEIHRPHEEHHRPEEHRPEEHRPEEHRPEEHRPEEHRPEEHRPEEFHHRPEEHHHHHEEHHRPEEHHHHHEEHHHRPEHHNDGDNDEDDHHGPEGHGPDNHGPQGPGNHGPQGHGPQGPLPPHKDVAEKEEDNAEEDNAEEKK